MNHKICSITLYPLEIFYLSLTQMGKFLLPMEIVALWKVKSLHATATIIEWFESKGSYTVLLERIEYDVKLNDYISNNGCLSLTKARLLFRHVIMILNLFVDKRSKMSVLF